MINCFKLPVPKNQAMIEDYERKKNNQVSQMRSIKDYGMGLFIILIGLFFLFREKLGNLSINERLGKPDAIEIALGIMCLIYGSWRVYRGYQKKYFK